MLESDSNAVNLKVQLGVWDLYWSMWRMFFTLPVALMLLVVVGLMILADFRDRTLDTVSFSVPVFLVVTFFASYLRSASLIQMPVFPTGNSSARWYRATVPSQGRIASHSAESELKRGPHGEGDMRLSVIGTFGITDMADEQFYSEQIQPRLGTVEVKRIAAILGISITYASYIRAGRRRPHPRHWETLTRLGGLSSELG